MSDSADARFWDVRYAAATTPWDAGGIPLALQGFASSMTGSPRVLIPGCGSGYEVGYLFDRGWDVLAIDFSVAAIAAARRVLGDRASALREADFFGFADDDVPFDIVYERALLCALPPRLWPAYAARVAHLVRPGGLLAGFFFFDETATGPPFGTSPSALAALLADRFALIADDAVSDSLPVFAGRERWQVWQRIGDDPAGTPHHAPDGQDI